MPAGRLAEYETRHEDLGPLRHRGIRRHYIFSGQDGALSSIRRPIVDASLHLDIESSHDFLRIEAMFLKSDGHCLLGVAVSVFGFPDRGCHDVAAACSFSPFIDETLDKPRQSLEDALNLAAGFEKRGP